MKYCLLGFALCLLAGFTSVEAQIRPLPGQNQPGQSTGLSPTPYPPRQLPPRQLPGTPPTAPPPATAPGGTQPNPYQVAGEMILARRPQITQNHTYYSFRQDQPAFLQTPSFRTLQWSQATDFFRILNRTVGAPRYWSPQLQRQMEGAFLQRLEDTEAGTVYRTQVDGVYTLVAPDLWVNVMAADGKPVYGRYYCPANTVTLESGASTFAPAVLAATDRQTWPAALQSIAAPGTDRFSPQAVLDTAFASYLTQHPDHVPVAYLQFGPLTMNRCETCTRVANLPRELDDPNNPYRVDKDRYANWVQGFFPDPMISVTYYVMLSASKQASITDTSRTLHIFAVINGPAASKYNVSFMKTPITIE